MTFKFAAPFALALIALLSPNRAMSRDINCDAVLIPETINTAATKTSFLLKLWEKSDTEYERLKNLSSSERELDASYGTASAEFNQSSTKEEFREHLRHSYEASQLSEFESSSDSRYRVGLSDNQVAAWLECTQPKAGGLLLHVDTFTETGFLLDVDWRLPNGIISDTLKLKLYGGTIDGKNFVELNFQNKTLKLFVVGSPTEKFVTVIGDTSSFSDAVYVRTAPLNFCEAYQKEKKRPACIELSSEPIPQYVGLLPNLRVRWKNNCSEPFDYSAFMHSTNAGWERRDGRLEKGEDGSIEAVYSTGRYRIFAKPAQCEGITLPEPGSAEFNYWQ